MRKPICYVVSGAVVLSGVGAIAQERVVPPDPKSLHQPDQPYDLPDRLVFSQSATTSSAASITFKAHLVDGMSDRDLDVTPLRELKIYKLRPPFKLV